VSDQVVTIVFGQERPTLRPRGLGPVQCAGCVHMHAWRIPGNFCDAFPDGDGIPAEIIIGEHDHKKPYLGDNGIQREEGEPQMTGPDGETLRSERAKLAKSLGIEDWDQYEEPEEGEAEFAFNPSQARDRTGKWTKGADAGRKGPKQPSQRTGGKLVETDTGGALGIGKGAATVAPGPSPAGARVPSSLDYVPKARTTSQPVGRPSWEGAGERNPDLLHVKGPLEEQMVRVAQSQRASMWDTAGVRRVAEASGFQELVDYIDGMADREDDMEWTSKLLELADEVSAAMGIEEPPGEPTEVTANLGVTPFRGKPHYRDDHFYDYFRSPRFKGFDAELRRTAQANGVRVLEATTGAGVWQGYAEPSVSVTVRGNPEQVRKVATQIGARYYQDAVMVFTPQKQARSGMYIIEGAPEESKYEAGNKFNPSGVMAQMEAEGITGGRLMGDRRVEIADDDGSLAEEVLASRLGASVTFEPGLVEWLSAGTDYEKPKKKQQTAAGGGRNVGRV
jgi:hypothetical protein